MLICRDARLESWETDFSSSAQGSADWIRVVLPEGAISNALNAIDWTESPVQVVLCESCGEPGCAVGGYVAPSRCGDWVLWSVPPASLGDFELEYRLLRRHGGLAIPAEEWTRWRARAPELPVPESLTQLDGRVLADAWRLSVVGPGRATELSEVVPNLQRKLLASDSLGVEGAIEAAAKIVAQLERMGEGAVQGSLVSPASIGATIECLYFDAPSVTEWPAFALRDGEVLLAVAKELVFVAAE
jgi:hypothetical protein